MRLPSRPPLRLACAWVCITCAGTLAAQAGEQPQRMLYVAPDGSDDNPGTLRAPLRTIQAAAKAARPGTTVQVAPGTYRENIESASHGTAAARILYVSRVKWGAKIIGKGSGAVWTNHGQYTEIKGFDISGSGRAGLINYASWVRVTNNHVHDLRLSGGCDGNGGGGIINANYKASDGEITGNLVHDIGVPGACSGVHGIYYTNLRGTIYNNIVYRVSAWGIQLWHAADQVVIANNTVFANGSEKVGGGIVIGTGDSPGGAILTRTRVINNIVYRNPGASIQQYCYPGQACIGAGNIVADNLVYGNGGEVRMLVGQAIRTIAKDPKFVDFRPDGTGDYRLRPDSPARRHGLAWTVLPASLDSPNRLRGPAVDIGAAPPL